jgi:hypothetical protein
MDSCAAEPDVPDCAEGSRRVVPEFQLGLTCGKTTCTVFDLGLTGIVCGINGIVDNPDANTTFDIVDNNVRCQPGAEGDSKGNLNCVPNSYVCRAAYPIRHPCGTSKYNQVGNDIELCVERGGVERYEPFCARPP